MLDLRLDQACYKLFLADETLTPAGELAFRAWLRADPIKAFKHVFSSAGGAIGFRWSHRAKIAHAHGDHSSWSVPIDDASADSASDENPGDPQR
jgi:hypothetical protein